MEPAELRLVGDAEREPRRETGRTVTLATAAVVLAAAAVATAFGADHARRPFAARDISEQAMRLALEEGSAAPAVARAVGELRREVGRRPLDSRTRIAYAGLLLTVAQEIDDAPAAVFHAGHAAALAPVTLPVVRAATMILARAGNAEEAGRLVRAMFEYDPPAAARLLAQIEPLLRNGLGDQLVPDDPEAWLAWAAELRANGEGAHADRWLDRAYARFPTHLRVAEWIAGRAARRRDFAALEAVFSALPPLPDERAAAPLLLYRAQLAVQRNDAAGARSDVKRALSVGGSARSIQVMAGEVYESIGDHEQARREWNRALNGLGPGDSPSRRLLLLYLARLEERHGRPALALRLWKELAALDPSHVEANRRIDDLSGFRR